MVKNLAVSVFVVQMLFVPGPSAFAQLDSARAKINTITREAKGVVGVAAIDLETGDTLTVHGDGHFPMQSVFKFPLALAVLDQIDKGAQSLKSAVHVSKADLTPKMWSPLREAYPDGEVDLPVDTLLSYTILYSDNVGCDVLFRLMGGTEVVNTFVHKLGIAGISIVATEHEMNRGWDVQYRNWSTPFGMAQLLRLFYDGKVLSKGSREHLWRLMVTSTTGPRRIRGLLPPGAVVGHKTGSSGTNEKGVAAATNDVGIIELPNGRHAALAVFVSDSDATEKDRDNVIASVARAVWDAYARK